MLPEKQSRKKEHETVLIEVPKARMRRPFPLGWGLAALLLLFCFALVTQVQFNRVNNENLFQARLDTYQSDVRAFDVAVIAHETCLASIETRDTYRDLFSGVSALFETTANLPPTLFPESMTAALYRTELLDQLEALLDTPVEEQLPPRSPSECPPIPDEPVPPTR